MTDLKNLVFGQLKVKSYSSDSLWNCTCSCGNEIIVSENDLLGGSVWSCGCTKDLPVLETKWIGQRWGRLTAIKHVGYSVKIRKDKKEKHSLCLFRCDCGNEKTMAINYVRYCNIRSCGCLAMEQVRSLRTADISGQTFGRLTAIRPTEKRTKYGSILWELSCQCGNTTYKTVSVLKSGRVSSCGCLYKESRKQCSSHRKDFLEETSVSSIVASKKLSSANKSGYTGVIYNKKNNKWQAYITYKRKTYALGYYEDKEDAIQARKEAEHILHDPVVMKNWDVLSDNCKNVFRKYMKQKN